MMRTAHALLAASAALAALAGCAAERAPAGKPAAANAASSWRRITQVDHRFAVFIDQPGAPKTGDLVTFKLVYIYAPGEVFWKSDPADEGPGREVDWQEYAGMTINCATGEMKPGPRVRYGPNGTVLLKDDDEAFGPINAGTAAEDAFGVRCTTAALPATVDIPNADGWRQIARKRLADTDPPARP